MQPTIAAISEAHSRIISTISQTPRHLKPFVQRDSYFGPRYIAAKSQIGVVRAGDPADRNAAIPFWPTAIYEPDGIQFLYFCPF
jgi:hypothetical protein